MSSARYDLVIDQGSDFAIDLTMTNFSVGTTSAMLRLVR